MVNTVNKIPSINLPLTTEAGTIHPIWYEFFREFIKNTDNSLAGTDNGVANTAGQGLFTIGDSFNVGAGAGIKVNTDSVDVDINGQTNAQAAIEDEILIVDASDASQIRKTSLRDVANLSPGTFPGGNNTAIQYNSSDTFEGDDNFTTDGNGSVSITGDLTVDNININGSTFAADSNLNPLVFEVPGGALNQFTFTQTGAVSSGMTATFRGLRASAEINILSDNDNVSGTANAALGFGTDGSVTWGMGLADFDSDNFIFATTTGLNINQVYKIKASGRNFEHLTDVEISSYLLRNTTAGITASTTQSQGNGALTAEVNEVSTVANTNDTVTLPTAQAGQKVWVINNGANTLQIFPASGDDLGAGTDTATTLVSGSNVTFIAYNNTNWVQDV